MRLKELYGVGEDWPITHDDLESSYCEAEPELGVSGDDEEWNGLLGAYRTKPFPMPAIVPSYGERRALWAPRSQLKSETYIGYGTHHGLHERINN